VRVLAVIPARAGSKGIPNKNVRLLHGKPLVYYAIDHAKRSEFITDIMVTTDSFEVEIIAKQMGVCYKRRSAELSGDSIALDSVVYDAAKEYHADYVVTMQPTSPTLKVGTLDAAIQYAISNDLDTVISVINRPHLSWVDKDGRKTPAYQERLNRQLLPPYFLETGAFMISRGDVVKPNSRIGQAVDVYEISDREAVDIDSFEDLYLAEHILTEQSVGFYVNGNNKRGIGHIYRVLELADEFYCKADIYYDVNQTDRSAFGITTHNLIPLNGIRELLSALQNNQYSIFINDILTTSIDYMIAVRTCLPKAKIINFEDDGEGIYKADLVFNALFQEELLSHVKAGAQCFIAPKLFMFYEPISIKDSVQRVFVSFGGADPQNYTDRVLEIISENEYSSYEFVVVLGRAKLNVEKLMEYGKYPNISVYYDVHNMPELMSGCDIGITSRGRTGYELAILGVPTISMAQNRREERHGFVCAENGFTYIGLNPSDAVIKATLDMYLKMSKETRTGYHEMLLSHDLRNGRQWVMNCIRAL
jgi:CMP-N-acetylneuraminic acid synthetase/spore coat polysaccharide biosynthesis predicted glycosyltransferase SpsG